MFISSILSKHLGKCYCSSSLNFRTLERNIDVEDTCERSKNDIKLIRYSETEHEIMKKADAFGSKA